MKIIILIRNMLIKLSRILLNDNFQLLFSKYMYPFLVLKKIDYKLKFLKISDKKFLIKYPNQEDMYFYNSSRAHRYIHGDGFLGMGKRLFNKYQLNKILFNKNDIIFEVGPNIGELTYFLSQKVREIHVFEPDELALKFLKLNTGSLKNININDCAVTNNLNRKNFYIDSNDASSSFIKNKNSTFAKEIKVTTLDEYITNKNFNQKIKLIKIEAEGFEPEVIDGLGKQIKNILNIAVDCGPERNGEKTIEQVSNILKKNNFDLFIEKDNCLGINKDV